jgi:lysozyme family protein
MTSTTQAASLDKVDRPPVGWDLTIYADRLARMKIRDWAKGEADRISREICHNQGLYYQVMMGTGVPWQWIGAIHHMESFGDFTKSLSENAPISDGSWVRDALEALNAEGYKPGEPLDWSDFSRWLLRAEQYDGWRYAVRQPEVPSPYLWSGTDQYTSGFYMASGSWNELAVSTKVGAVAIWASLGMIPPRKAITPSEDNIELEIMQESKAVSAIDLKNVFQWWRGLPHQLEAVKYLQGKISDADLAEFARIWRSSSEAVSAAVPAADPLVADQISKLNKYAKSGSAVVATTKATYYSQRDNYTMAGRTCNSSTSAMYLNWLRLATGQDSLGGDDGYLQKLLAIGDTIYHENQTECIKRYGFNTKWIDCGGKDPTPKDFAMVDSLLDGGFPVPVNILHRGSKSAPEGGHVILLIGRRKSEGTYISHDPYGTLSSNYTDSNGRYSLISKADFLVRWQGGRRVLA